MVKETLTHTITITLATDDPEDLTAELNRIAGLIGEGYNQGEVNGGWWDYTANQMRSCD